MDVLRLEGIINGAPNIRNPVIVRNHVNPLDLWNDKQLLSRYRFNREGILYLCDLIGDDFRRETMRANALTVEQIICLSLRFFASGSFQEVSTL